MSKIVGEVVAANEAYVRGFGKKGELPLPPARRFAILTCMDARLDPAKYAGLAEGDAHVIRNAGGRATDDAIRSLVISHKLLGTQEWFVIHQRHPGRASHSRASPRSHKRACLWLCLRRSDRTARRSEDRDGSGQGGGLTASSRAGGQGLVLGPAPARASVPDCEPLADMSWLLEFIDGRDGVIFPRDVAAFVVG